MRSFFARLLRMTPPRHDTPRPSAYIFFIPMIRTPLSFLLTAFFAVGVFAQTPSLRETVDVRVTSLDVVVTDRAGYRVEGLTAADFTLLENGRLQRITNFSELRDAADSSAAEPQPPRRIAIFVDTLTLDPQRRERLRDALFRLIESGVRPGDLATVLSWRGGLASEIPFTDDPHALRGAIERAVMRSGTAANPLEQRALDLEQEWFTMTESAMQAAGVQGGPFDREGHLDMSVEARARREYADVVRRAAALQQWIGSIAGAEGRKILLVTSNRITMNASGAFEAAAGRREAPRDSRWNTGPLVEAIASSANASRVTLYTIHPEGASRGGAGAEVGGTIAVSGGTLSERTAETMPAGGHDALSFLAENTGGSFAYGPGETDRLVTTLSDDLGSYYSIGYAATESAMEKERRIEVRVARGLIARSRRSIVEKSPLSRASDQVVANLVHPFAPGGLRISATPGEERTAKGGRIVPVEIRIPVGSLTFVDRDGFDVGGFSILVASGGGYESSETSVQRQDVRFPLAEREKAKASHITYALEVEIRGEACCISLGVLDDVSAELGLVRLDLRGPRSTVESAPAIAEVATATETVTTTETSISTRSLAEVFGSQAAGVRPEVRGQMLADPDFLRAAELSRDGTPEEAIAAWQGVIYRRPEDPLAHHNLGVVYLRIEEWRKAAESFEKSLRLNRQNDVAQYNLAWAYFKLGQHRAARRAAQRALDLNPGYEKAKALLDEIRR
jgi:VWFA-related protein